MKQISKKELTEDVNKGMRMNDLATKYELNANQMKAVMKEAGLKIKRTVNKSFVLLDDVNITNQVKVTGDLKETFGTVNTIN